MGKRSFFGSQVIFVSIKTYQYFLSPLVGNCCKFYPSCSTYALEAFSTHGFFYGLCLTSKRILKCNPVHSGGIDLVPEKKHKARQ